MTLTMVELHQTAEDQQLEVPTVMDADQWQALPAHKPKVVCEHKTIFTKVKILLITGN